MREDYADGDDGSVDLRFVHVCKGGFTGRGLDVDDVGSAAVGHD